MFLRPALLPLVLAAAPAVTLAAGWSVDLTSSRHADAIPLHRLDIEDVAGQLDPRPGRNIAYLHDELRVSRQSGPSTWSLLVRNEATLTGTRDSFDLARSVETVGTPEQSRQWLVDAQFRSYVGAGVAWRRAFQVASGWDAWFGVQALWLTQWREFALKGPAAYDAALKQWRFDLRYERNDTRLDLPFQDPYAGSGQALLTEGGLRWTVGDVAAAVSWRDAGWARWRGLPQQHLVLSTTTQAVDSDGFVIYKPLAQGGYHQRTLHRDEAGIVTTRLTWAMSPDTLWAVSADHVADFGYLPRLAVRHRVADASLSGAYDVHERRLGVGVAWRGLQLAFGTDRLGDEARSREFRVAYAWGGD